jgi:hypothetical protein
MTSAIGFGRRLRLDPLPPVWEASTGSRITGAPAVARGTLLVGTEDGVSSPTARPETGGKPVGEVSV